MAFVRGSGSTPGAARMAHSFVEEEIEFQHQCSFAHNPRLCFDWVLQRGGAQTSIGWERIDACLDLS